MIGAAKELGLDDNVEVVPVLGVVDPLAEQTIYQLEEELATDLRKSDYVNVLIDTLAKHLVRYYAKTTWTRNNVGGFPKYLLDRTLDYIESSPDLNLSVREIAGAVGIDADRFSRAFRAATGKGIRHYLSERAERLSRSS